MPRKKSPVRKVQKTLQVPEDLMAKLDILIMDPATGKMPHGFFSDLCVALLRQWVAQRIKEKTNDPGPQEPSNRSDADSLGHPRGDGRLPLPQEGAPSHPAGPSSEGDTSPSPSSLFRNMQNLRDDNLQRDEEKS